MYTPIIAVAGRVGSGKTSLIDFIRRDGYSVQRVSIADTLKDEVAAALGISRIELDMTKDTVRPVLVAWSEYKRSVDPNYWISKAIDRIKYGDMISASVLPNPMFYVDDVRYLNEVAALKAVGAVMVHLLCPTNDSVAYMQARGLTEAQALGIATSQGEEELTTIQPGLWDITCSGPRKRPLRAVYDYLIMQLLRGEHLKALPNA